MMVNRQGEIRRWVHHDVRVHRGLRDVVIVLVLHLVRVIFLVTVVPAGRPRDVVVVVVVIVLPVVDV